MLDSITVSRTYPQPPEKVWRAITEAKAVSQWLMPCDIAPTVGHQFTFQTEPGPGFDGTVRCEVLIVNPPEEFSYSWRGGSLSTIVTFTLQPSAQGGTELQLAHTGFSGLFNKLFVRNFLAAGWKRKLLSVRLPQYLDQHG